MARKSHFSKSISILLLMSIVSVTLLPTDAYWYWTTEKSGNFNGTFEAETERIELGVSSQIIASRDDATATMKVYAKAVPDVFYGIVTQQGQASITYIYDTSIIGNAGGLSTVSGESYRAFASYYIQGSQSGPNHYIEISVKLIYFSGFQRTATLVTTKYYSSSDPGQSFTVYTPGYGMGSPARQLYVEVSVRIYTRAATSNSVSIVDVNGFNYIQLTNWGIQHYVESNGGPI